MTPEEAIAIHNKAEALYAELLAERKARKQVVAQMVELASPYYEEFKNPNESLHSFARRYSHIIKRSNTK